MKRFWEKVDKSSLCWNWTGALSFQGYGRFSFNGENVLAHRLAYLLEVGEIPQGKELHHLCANKRCVNPSHLIPVTRKEHPDCAPALLRAKTHCPQGHPYSGENLLRDSQSGGRRCKICRIDQRRLP